MSRGERIFNTIRGYAAVAMIYAAAYRMGGWDAVCIAAGAILLAISMFAGLRRYLDASRSMEKR